MFLQEHSSRSRGLDSYYGTQQSMQGMVWHIFFLTTALKVLIEKFMSRIVYYLYIRDSWTQLLLSVMVIMAISRPHRYNPSLCSDPDDFSLKKKKQKANIFFWFSTGTVAFITNTCWSLWDPTEYARNGTGCLVLGILWSSMVHHIELLNKQYFSFGASFFNCRVNLVSDHQLYRAVLTFRAICKIWWAFK